MCALGFARETRKVELQKWDRNTTILIKSTCQHRNHNDSANQETENIFTAALRDDTSLMGRINDVEFGLPRRIYYDHTTTCSDCPNEMRGFDPKKRQRQAMLRRAQFWAPQEARSAKDWRKKKPCCCRGPVRRVEGSTTSGRLQNFWGLSRLFLSHRSLYKVVWFFE